MTYILRGKTNFDELFRKHDIRISNNKKVIMDTDILLSEFNCVGRIIIYQASVHFELASFCNNNFDPIQISEIYANNELDNSIPYDETFMDFFAFNVYENGGSPMSEFVFRDTNIHKLSPIIENELFDTVEIFKRKIGHHPLVEQRANPNMLDLDLVKFNTWGRLIIEPNICGIVIEIAAQLDDGSIIKTSKGYEAKKNQIKTKTPTVYEVGSVLKNGKFTTEFLIAPLIENHADLQLSRLVIYEAVEELRSQSGFYTVGEEIRRYDEEDKPM
jgi:hypothetical protein